MDDPALKTHTQHRQIDTLNELWYAFPSSLSQAERLDLVFPLLFLRLANIHADETLAETADICWTELSESKTPLATYLTLRAQLAEPNTWPEATIFAALPSLTAEHEQALQNLLAWLQELDMYTLQYHDIGEFWETCLQHCTTDTSTRLSTSYAAPSALVNVLVALLQPQPEQHFYDPAACSGSFLVAAHDYVHMLLEERDSLPPEQTCRITAQVHSALEQRLCLANLRLHDIPMSDLQISLNDAHRTADAAPAAVDMIFANLIPQPDSDRLALLQHSLSTLNPNGHALFLLPDKDLSASELTAWRRDCLQNYQLHTLLRLPTGLFAQDSSALFFSHTGSSEKLWIYDLRTQLPEQSPHSQQLASLLGHFTLAYGEDRLPNTQKRQARAAKDARLRLWHIEELGDSLDLTLAWLSNAKAELPALLSHTSRPSKPWRGLLDETLEDLQQLGKFLHHDDNT